MLPLVSLLVLGLTVLPVAEPIVRRSPLAHAQSAFEKGAGRVAFLGGSITEMPGWRVKVMDDLQKRFPKTKFSFACAGLSSTCSDTGAYRLEEDVYRLGVPDLIFVEYAVNDSGDGYYRKGQHDPSTYAVHTLRGVEGVIRHIRSRDRRTDIVMTHFVDGSHLPDLRAGRLPSTYAIDERVARHYDVTTVSIGAALVAAERNGTFDWKRYGANCHPKEAGCQFVFEQYQKLFDAEWPAWRPASPDAQPKALPPALDSLCYAAGRYFDLRKVVCADGGWKIGPVDWSKQPGVCRGNYRAGDLLVSDQVCATCSFEFSGTAVGAFVLAGPDSGSLEVSIDGGAFKAYEMFSPYSKGSKGLHYPFVETFADDLKDGSHRIVLRVGRARNESSTGNWVRIYRLCVNGGRPHSRASCN